MIQIFVQAYEDFITLKNGMQYVIIEFDFFYKLVQAP